MFRIHSVDGKKLLRTEVMNGLRLMRAAHVRILAGDEKHCRNPMDAKAYLEYYYGWEIEHV